MQSNSKIKYFTLFGSHVLCCHARDSYLINNNWHDIKNQETVHIPNNLSKILAFDFPFKIIDMNIFVDCHKEK